MIFSFKLQKNNKGLVFVLFLALFAQFSHAQVSYLTGRVLDNSAELVGATVKVMKGLSLVRGVVTDIDGNFRIALDSGIYNLEVSYTGYKTQKIYGVEVISGQITTMKDIVMASPTGLSEAVVVGYSMSSPKKSKPAGGKTLSKGQYDKLAKRSAPANYATPEASKETHRKQKKQAEKNPAHQKETAIVAKNEPGTFQKTDTLIEPTPHESSAEQYDRIIENPFQDASKSNISTFSIDVDAASYSNLRRFLNAGSMPPADAVRIEEMINYFDYQYNAPTGAHPFEANVEVAPCPWNTDNRLMMIGLQGVKMDVEQLPASNLVFLIDVSGSMGTDDKLPLVIQSLDLLVDQLRPVDRVSIVVYAGAAGLVLPGTSGSEKGKIKASLGELYAGGSTAGGDGIKLAYATARNNFAPGGNNRVILCTDGDFNVGVSSEADLLTLIEEERKSGVYLTVLGFGTGNYQDGKMQLLADKGNGNHAYIDQLSEAQKVLVQEFGGTLFAIAKDVKLQLHFNPAIVAGYRLIGYENRMLATEDFNDDTKDAGELGSGHRVTALYEIVPKGHELPALTKADAALVVTQAPDKSVKITANDMMVMQLRYKKPKGDAPSQLMEYRLNAAAMKNKNESANFQLAAAVAEFGLLLRDSKYKSAATYAHALENAKKASSFDPNGYRKELVGLIETAARTTEKIK